MKKYSIVLVILVGLFGCGDDYYPVDEDGLLITDRAECFVSNFELLDTDYQTVRTKNAVIDTVAQTIDVEVRWGTNLKRLWPQFTLVTDAKLDPKITDWTDFTDISSPREWTVISGNRKVKKTYSVNITIQQLNP
ncbi:MULTISPECIES: hypothetical protein [Sphingobacterium]|uniref:Uncharacterized protein n=2 Tax=Sphingobacterium TaxID=28453 RepID=A0A2S9JTX6_9SPHI|nr:MULTISPECIES: hypothetical protein [Sphingobacterium]PRD48115.1 hypothetical protein C5745_06280 [Sphingobacterium haloxyli]PRD56601.1 hypothetical protein C5749_05010 [Sphingobacterium gobiense]